MKCIREHTINSRFSRVRIIADTTPASMEISAEDVKGLDNHKTIATGSIMVCLDTGKTYICNEQHIFTEADAAAVNYFFEGLR